jgi:hypothetical protein
MALSFDIGQYVAGYFLHRQMLSEMKRTGSEDIGYNAHVLLFRLRLFSFHAKIVLGLAATVWLLIILTRHLIHRIDFSS